MGLAQQKVKQRINIDPQNKTWQEDTTKVGFKLLSKMGWTSGKGLGAGENGMSSNIKVSVKDNNLGIGATHNSSDSWLENAFGFDNMLKNFDAKDDTIFTMPESTENKSKAIKIGKRHAHRKKFVKSKMIAGCDSAHLNNILGKKATDDQEKVSNTQNVTFTSTTSTMGIQDYFAKKMAEKNISLGLNEEITESEFESDKKDQSIKEIKASHKERVSKKKKSKKARRKE